MKVNYFSCFVSFLILFTSCVNQITNDTVLKKSSDPTPAWINENGKINSTNSDYINLVFTKGNLYNLSLGVKQSQVIASKKISYLMLAEVQNQILQRLEKINFTNKKTSTEAVILTVSRVVNKYLAEFKIDPPLAEQVYWEYRQQERVHDSKQYYVVWVLLLVPKAVYDKAFLAIAHELQNSKDEAVATLGNDILQQSRSLN